MSTAPEGHEERYKNCSAADRCDEKEQRLPKLSAKVVVGRVRSQRGVIAREGTRRIGLRSLGRGVAL